MHHLFILSDGTGWTAEQSVRAALTQYADTKVKIHVCPDVKTEEDVVKYVTQASQLNGFIVHTIVSGELREIILETGRLNNVETTDLMGPLLGQFSNQFSDSPSEKPGLFHDLNKAYFQRIEAMEFAFRHDDGQRIKDLLKSEIVLLGVSRTFKTPLSIYFAFKGWFAANVPVILGIDPPSELFKIPPERVFGLTANPHSLTVLRRVRHEHLGGSTGEYADPEYVRREINYSQSIFNKRPEWPVINVSHKPIEEIASEILSILRKNKTKKRYKL